MSGFVVFLGAETLPWVEIEHGRIVARGDDLLETVDPVVAIAPTEGLTFRVASLGDLSPLQALAAARLDAADVSLGAARHIAVSIAGDHYVITDRATMVGWLSGLAVRGLQVRAVVPSCSLLPIPESGFVRAELPNEVVLRSAETALVEDDTISALIVGEAPITTLSGLELEMAIVSAFAEPPINLLQGEFAPRADWGASPGYWRRMGVLGGVLLALTIALPVAQWAKLTSSTSELDRKSAAVSAKALGESRASDDAVERLQQRLIAQRGGGAGFLATQAAVVAAIESTPNTELASLSFDPDGTLHAVVRASGRPEIDALRRSIAARGFLVSDFARAMTQGRPEVELQVRPR